MARTVTQRADRVTAGTQMRIMDRDATVTGIKTLIERGPLGHMGPVSDPQPYYWVEITFGWDGVEDVPESAIVIEGNRWVNTRDSLDQPK